MARCRTLLSSAAAIACCAAAGSAQLDTLFDEPEPNPRPRSAESAPPTAAERLARALFALRRFDPEAVRDALGDLDGEAADRVRRDADLLTSVLSRYVSRVADEPGAVALVLPLPTRPARLVPHFVDEWDADLRCLIVERNDDFRSVPIERVPPELFAESLAKADVAIDDAEQSALGVLLAVSTIALDEPDRRKALRRAARAGVLDQREVLAPVQPLLFVLGACARARAEVERAENATPILDALAVALHDADLDDVARRLAGAVVPSLLRSVFDQDPAWHEVLRGAVTRLHEDVIRVTYDWSDAAQAEDWLPVESGRDGLEYLPNEAAGARVHVQVDTTKRELWLLGRGYVRHVLQFNGDVTLTIRPALRTERVGERRTVTRMPQTGTWLISARRPNTFVEWYPLTPERHLTLSVGGQRSERVIEERAWDDVVERIRKRKQTMTIERSVGTVTVRAGDRAYGTLDVATPNSGAILFLQPFREEPGRDGTLADAQVGKVTIEGRPHRERMDVARRRYVERWRAKFPLR